MAIIKNKTLYVLNDDNTYVPFRTVKNEVFLTQDLSQSTIFNATNEQYLDYINAIKAPVSYRLIRIYLLNDDETIYKDVSDTILNDWSIDFNQGSGQIRSASITLINTRGIWAINPVTKTLWKGTKFRIHTGVFYAGIAYWKDCGVFVANNPTVETAKQTISVALNDKYALIDGTIGGKRAYEYRISRGTTIKSAIEASLLEKNDVGKSFDEKPIIFPYEYMSENTTYDINKDPNMTIGELIQELATNINCDVHYNELGNLIVEPTIITNDDFKSKPVQWTYIEENGQYSNPSMSINFDKLINKVIVAGAIENGEQYKAEVVNTSPLSQANIYLTEPNPLYIEDGNIVSNDYCMQRARYELAKQGRLGIELRFKSVYIPHLECNNLICFSNKKMGFVNELMVVNSIHISADFYMDITAASVNEVSLL